MPRFGGYILVADTKKSDTASEETARSDEDMVDEAQDSDVEVGDQGASEDTSDGIEDAEIIEEAADETEPDLDDGSVATEAAEHEVPPEEDASDEGDTPGEEDPSDETLGEEASEGMEAEELAEPDDPEEIADLETMDGVETAEDAAATVAAAAVGADTTRATEEPTRTIEKETVVVERKGALVPGLLGGAIAAVGVLFAAPYVIPANMMPANPELQQALESQSDTITALEAEIASLRTDLSGTASSSALASLKAESEAAVSTLTSGADEMKGALEGLTAEIASGSAFSAITERLESLEKRPIAEATDPASIAAVEAYGRELAGLRESVAAQMDQADNLVKSAAAAAEKSVKEAMAAASSAVADAEAAAKAAEEKAAAETAAANEKALTAARAQALVDIQSALDSGDAFADKLPVLDGVALPEALNAAAAEGVATATELQEDYTLAARKALSVSRSEVSDGSAGDRASTWIQNQLGLRSLAPSEGSDPDAVLSRAEAALKEGRLKDAVTELSALPEGGQQIMAEWVALATARAEALAAADELAASLATN